MRIPVPGSDPGRRPRAGELFTDRLSESEAFKQALATFRRLLDSDTEVGIARHNVVAYYGMGGIGKTALSERLESWARDDLPLHAGWGPRPSTRVDATARIDLHGSTGQMDIAQALLALRAGVAGLQRRWPMFDLAFGAYWSATHPSEPLPNVRALNYDGLVGETTENVLNDIGQVLEYSVVNTPVGVGLRGVRAVLEALRRRHDVKVLRGAREDFERLLLRCADEPSPTDPRPELLCELATTFAWELAAITPNPLVAVFVDTTERLELDPRRVSERHLNMLVHRMPNVLFVLTGREMMTWHEVENSKGMPYWGPRTWPGLVPGTSEGARQHLVGRLSEDDTRAVILKGRAQLDLPIDDDVVNELVVASAGLPQYLELARQIAVTVQQSGTGERVRAEDVTGSLSSLVMRVLDHVPADEQRAIRAACLFRVFDTQLIAEAADVDHGCAERAVMRPLIDRYEAERFPFRIHDAVREAIRKAGHGVTGGWSERDWEAAATRAAKVVRVRHDTAKVNGENSQVMDLVGIAVLLACEQDTHFDPPAVGSSYPDWLTKAIVYAPSLQGLRSRVPGSSATSYGQGLLDFITAKSMETPAQERVRLLRGLFESDHPLRFPAGRHLGYTYKAMQQWDEAIAAFDALVEADPSGVNKAQVPQTLNLARRFEDALDAAQGLSVMSTIVRVTEYAHGLPARYFTEIGEKFERLRRLGRQREWLEEMGVHLARRAWLLGDVDETEIDRFLVEAEGAGHVAAMRDALLATVLNQGRSPSEIEAALDRLRSLDLAASLHGEIGYRWGIAEYCDAHLKKDDARLDNLADEVSRVAFRTRSWIPVECFLESSGRQLEPVPTQWLEPYSAVRRRWVEHLERYLTSHG